MSDVKLEYEQMVSRDEAAAWLSQLARAFAGDRDAEFPFGPGTVKLHLPESVRTELEVEIEDDQVEVEIEFTWPLPSKAKPAVAVAPGAKRVSSTPERGNGAVRPGHAVRTKRK